MLPYVLREELLAALRWSEDGVKLSADVYVRGSSVISLPLSTKRLKLLWVRCGEMLAPGAINVGLGCCRHPIAATRISLGA